MEKSETTALVTGATGFIGGHVVRRLAGEGWPVRVLVRDPARLPPELQGRVEFLRGDLSDGDALRRAVRDMRVVIHCAANVRTWDEPGAYRAANVAGVASLVEAIAAENGSQTRLVHLSTVDVYGYPKEPAGENAAIAPCGFGYSDSKREGEELLRRSCTERGVPWVVLRPSNVMGPGSEFIARIGAALISGLMIRIGGGAANAGFLDVENLVDAILWAAQAPVAAGRCYNVRDSCDVSWRQLLDDLRRGIGGRGRIVDLPFGVAHAAAAGCEGVYRLLDPRREPPLHRMLVHMFGRTCGHPADRIRADGCPPGAVSYRESMDRSIRWFLDQQRVRCVALLNSSSRAT